MLYNEKVLKEDSGWPELLGSFGTQILDEIKSGGPRIHTLADWSTATIFHPEIALFITSNNVQPMLPFQCSSAMICLNRKPASIEVIPSS